MIALIQRVTHANVTVGDETIGKTGEGILLLLGVEKGDTHKNADDLLNKVINFRIFADEDGKMNVSLLNFNGELLVVPQFTLPANTQKGTRPSFASAASPKEGQLYYDYFVEQARELVSSVETGEFGADMQVSLCNDGPVTFWIQK
ncbi:MAG: D-aminoacyl-tRNA deacylase [Cocleimonas sp.]|nr:D-aminoacyl-tRNA deacylase [Cocleimonas sp.]